MPEQKKRMPTTEKLALALEKAHAPKRMINKARMGHYDDFKGHVAQNISLLVNDCNKHGLTTIAERAMRGDFDASNEEAKEWAQSAEGREVLKELGL